MKIKKATIVRTLLLAVAIINNFLTARGSGFHLVLSDELAGDFADLFLAIVSIVVFWYNNSFTRNAIAADNYLAELRGIAPEEEEDDGEEED